MSAYSEVRIQPYREFWFTWHFWNRLIGGVAHSWSLSSSFDTNPEELFSTGNELLFEPRIA
ncbi:MAG: hypothetical protein QX198_02025 [Methylococcaceae bacterium]